MKLLKEMLQGQKAADLFATDKGKPVTKKDPLVVIWNKEKGEGIMGHMNLSTFAKIYQVPMLGLADRVHKAGEGKRVKAGDYYLEWSKWNDKHFQESVQLEEGITEKDWNAAIDRIVDLIIAIAKEDANSGAEYSEDVFVHNIESYTQDVTQDIQMNIAGRARAGKI